jgi:N-acylneuraminate cytidylyltransferase/CMP-N,N'-diacetyllegionaminic acid synthase
MILASICMRGGSKGVIGKNSRNLLGLPLMTYTFDCAKRSKVINELVVSSDSDEIIEISKRNDIKYLFKRKDILSTDDASKWEVFKDLVLRFEEQTGQTVKYLVDLDVTVPRRKTEHIDSSVDMIIKNSIDVVITGYEPERNPYFNMMELNDNNTAQLVKKTRETITCRQNAPVVYSLTPAVFVIKRSALFEFDHWSDAVCMINPIPREFAIDIDTELDFKIVECLMSNEQI